MKAVLLEHDEQQYKAIKHILESNGVDIILPNAGNILEIIKQQDVDFVVVDFAIPGLNVNALMDELKAYNQNCGKTVQLAITTASVDGDLCLLVKFLELYMKSKSAED